ncbi:MAG: 1-acyl-sn-glycerol-3-phosphate acyltransferase [Acidimicrobiia bacterium]|nr:1-acyl-sn-glycerol-3-phosphate acyltransferase [Acidimicrobiia bacterium]
MNREVLARRIRSVGSIGIMLVVLTPLMPLFLVLAGLLGLLRRTNFVVVRLLVFGWLYLVGELLGVCRAGAIMLIARPGSRRFLDLNYRLQTWWALFLFRWVSRLLRLSFEVQGDDELEPGPILIFMRHASIIDNLLPLVFVSEPHNLRIRYVLKKELLSDPALDIVGNRLPNFFIDRASSDEAQLQALRDLVTDLEPHEGAIIYPEGTRFTRRKRHAILAKLEGSEFFERASALERVLPPRINGPLAMLEGAPGADVIICAHHGLEGFATVGDILSGRLVGSTITVMFRRIARRDVPTDRQLRIDWLYAEWARVDADVAD